MERFHIYLQPAEEGGYIVSVSALPGCVTQGETKEEALEMFETLLSVTWKVSKSTVSQFLRA